MSLVCVTCRGSGYALSTLTAAKPRRCWYGCPVPADESTRELFAAPGPIGTLPLTIVIMPGPKDFSVEVTVDGALRYISGGHATQRAAAMAACDWAERQGAK